LLRLLLQVLAEVAQMRSGWCQAKAIIKQQRRTIKQQGLQLQLALNGALPGLPGLGTEQLQQQQLDDTYAAGMAAVGRLTADARSGGGSFPITSFVLQQQQPQQQQQQQLQQWHPGSSAGGSLGWAAVHHVSLGGNDDGRTAAVQDGKSSSREASQGLGALGLQQGQSYDQVPAGSTMHQVGIPTAVEQQQEELAAKNAAGRGLWPAQQRMFGAAAAADSSKGASGAAELLGCTNEILRSLRAQ
jgi:hypothetical protein